MTWIKLEDKTPRHPKIAGLSDKAFRAWVHSLCYASEFLTDGLVPAAFLVNVKLGIRDELLRSGLWARHDERVEIHDYLQYQNSREYVEIEKNISRRRSAMARDSELRSAIQARDGNNCRYCGCVVVWTDRRGPTGASYDHVIPRGPETLENLVVACRRCNGKKHARTPEQAGMNLLPPRTNLGLTTVNTRPEEEDRRQKTDTERAKDEEERSSSSLRGVPLIRSQKEIHEKRRYCAFVGARLDVPTKLHGDLRRTLGGPTADADLLAWYEDLDAEIERTTEKILPDVFKWVEARFRRWQSKANDDPVALAMATFERQKAAAAARKVEHSS